MTAMLSAVAFVLMFLEFSVPIMPPFIKMDLSDLPELIGAFAMGPVSGVAICLIVFNAPFTLVKGLFSVVITVLIYKHISPFLKGTNRDKN